MNTEVIPVYSQAGEIAYQPIQLPPPAPHPERPGVEVRDLTAEEVGLAGLWNSLIEPDGEGSEP